MLAKPLKLIAVQWTASKLPNSNHKPSLPQLDPPSCASVPLQCAAFQILPLSILPLSNKMHIFSERHAVYQ
jgi:hypothetical protein